MKTSRVTWRMSGARPQAAAHLARALHRSAGELEECLMARRGDGVAALWAPFEAAFDEVMSGAIEVELP